MKIAYLLESAVLCGGVKVVLRQAEALANCGYQVVVICKDNFPRWFDGKINYVTNDPLDINFLKKFSHIIATSPLQVIALFGKLHVGVIFCHLVQGYEGDLKEASFFSDKISKAYNLPVLRITISNRLTKRLTEVYPNIISVSVGQGLEKNIFYQTDNKLKKNLPVDKIFLFGPITMPVKNIITGLKAFKKLKKLQPSVELIRISVIDTKKEEEKITGQNINFNVHITPCMVGNILRNSNGILLSPSASGEGFGLPAIEAMACGVPVVLSDIPSHKSFDLPCNYANFVPPNNPDAMAQALNRLIVDKDKRQKLIQRGLSVAQKFSYKKVAEKLIDKVINKGSLKFIGRLLLIWFINLQIKIF